MLSSAKVLPWVCVLLSCLTTQHRAHQSGFHAEIFIHRQSAVVTENGKISVCREEGTSTE